MQLVAEEPTARWYPPPTEVGLLSLRLALNRWVLPFYQAAWFGNAYRELDWEREQAVLGTSSSEQDIPRRREDSGAIPDSQPLA